MFDLVYILLIDCSRDAFTYHYIEALYFLFLHR